MFLARIRDECHVEREFGAEIAAGRYSSASEYVRELIRNDEKRKAEEQIAALLREGLQSEETALTRDDWKAIRAEALARVKQAAKRKR